MKANSVDRVDITNEEEFMKWCKNLKVQLIGNQYESLIDQHNKEIEKRKIKEREKYRENLSFELRYRLNYEIHQGKKTVLNIDVSDNQKIRAYTFMNYFIKAVRTLGGSVSVDSRENDNTVVSFPYCTFECSLLEKKCKYRNVKPEGLKAMKPLYDIVNTGKLVFKIYAVDKNNNPSNELVFDEEKNMLENQIKDMFINLRTILLEINQKNIKAEQITIKEYENRQSQLELKRKLEKEEEELKKLFEIKMKQQGVIEQHREKWKYLKEIETYIADINKYADKQPNNIKESIMQYCNCVRDLFDINDFFTEITKFVQNMK